MPGTVARRAVFRLRDLFDDAELDQRDGLKASWSDRWIHVRPSNTEPLLRVHVEAPDQDGADALRERVLAEVRRLQERS